MEAVHTTSFRNTSLISGFYKQKPLIIFSVLPGNVEELHCQKIFPQVALILKDHNFDVDFYISPIRGMENSAGSTLAGRPRVTDYENLAMQFLWKDNLI